MRNHSAYSLIPAAGAVGATVMAYNAGIDIAQDQGIANAGQYSINTSELNFMGVQDAFIAGSLLIGCAALARGMYLYSQGQNADARKWFAIGGSLLMAAGLYALTAGFFDLGLPASKIGDFEPHPRLNGTIFGVVYSALSILGLALLGTAYKMSNANTVKNQVVPPVEAAPPALAAQPVEISQPVLTTQSLIDVNARAAASHATPVQPREESSINNNNNNNGETRGAGAASANEGKSAFSRLWSSIPSVRNPFSSSPQPGK